MLMLGGSRRAEFQRNVDTLMLMHALHWRVSGQQINNKNGPQVSSLGVIGQAGRPMTPVVHRRQLALLGPIGTMGF